MYTYIVQVVSGLVCTLYRSFLTLYVHCTGCFWSCMYRLFLALYVHCTSCIWPCMYIVQVVSGRVFTLYNVHCAWCFWPCMYNLHCTGCFWPFKYTVQGVYGRVCTRFFLALFYKHCTPEFFAVCTVNYILEVHFKIRKMA